jgi:hypothetical protein
MKSARLRVPMRGMLFAIALGGVTIALMMIARKMDELALLVRMIESTTPAGFEARVAIHEAAVRADREAISYEESRASFSREVPCTAFGHSA